MTARDTVRAQIQTFSYNEELSGVFRGVVGATALGKYRLIEIDRATELLVPVTGGKNVCGVADLNAAVGAVLSVRYEGQAMVYPSTAIAGTEDLVAVSGGFVAPYRNTPFDMMSGVLGADNKDDINQAILPSKVDVVCGGAETGHSVVVWGVVGGVFTKETIRLGAAGTYAGVQSFTRIYMLQTTAAAVGTLDIRAHTGGANLIPQILALAAARYYGGIVPDNSTDAKGLEPQIRAEGANGSVLLMVGTNYAGVEQTEAVTMDGTSWVRCLSAYRTVTRIGVGADGITWNTAPATYDMQAPHTRNRIVWAHACDAEAGLGHQVPVRLVSEQFDKQAWFPGVQGGVENWLNGATPIANNRVVDIVTATSLLAAAPVAAGGGKIFGVSDEPIAANALGRVRVGGKALVYPTTPVALQNPLVAVSGGFVAPSLAADFDMATAQLGGADAMDDLLVAGYGAGSVVTATPTGNEALAGNTLVITGVTAALGLTTETLVLGNAVPTVGLKIFTRIYMIQQTAASVNNIAITGGGGAILSLVGVLPARYYGRIVPDTSVDAKGLECRIKAGGANTGNLLVVGTDYANNLQVENVVMNGTTYVPTTLAYRSIDFLYVGADDKAWNSANATYDLQAPHTRLRSVRGWAENAQIIPGEMVGMLQQPQRVGLADGASTLVFAGRFTATGGAVFEDFACPGVLVTDAIQVTTNVVGATPKVFTSAEFQAANTVRVTYTGNFDATTQISITIHRP